MYLSPQVRKGDRSTSPAFYRKSDYGCPGVPISHEFLAGLLEAKFHPINKFLHFLDENGNSSIYGYRPQVANNFNKIFINEFILANSPAMLKENMEKSIQLSWRYWLKNNMGGFILSPSTRKRKKKNPIPLIDTGQYLNSLSFKLVLDFSDGLQLKTLYSIYNTRKQRESIARQWLKDGLDVDLSYDTYLWIENV